MRYAIAWTELGNLTWDLGSQYHLRISGDVAATLALLVQGGSECTIVLPTNVPLENTTIYGFDGPLTLIGATTEPPPPEGGTFVGRIRAVRGQFARLGWQTFRSLQTAVNKREPSIAPWAREMGSGEWQGVPGRRLLGRLPSGRVLTVPDDALFGEDDAEHRYLRLWPTMQRPAWLKDWKVTHLDEGALVEIPTGEGVPGTALGCGLRSAYFALSHPQSCSGALRDRLSTDGAKLAATAGGADVTLDPHQAADLVRDLVAFGSRHIGSPKNVDAVRAIGSALASCGNTFASAAPYGLLALWNVVCEMGPQETPAFVLSAHLDSTARCDVGAALFAPGADDDASGVAVIAGVAKALLGVQLKKRLIVVAFNGEEEGFVGSRWFTRNLAARYRVVGNIQIDMVGRPDEDRKVQVHWGSDVSGAHACGEGSERLADLLTTVGGPRVWQAFGNDGAGVRRSDHCAFHEVGIPAVCVTEQPFPGTCGNRPHYHTENDDTCDVPFCVDVGTVVGKVVSALTC